MGSGRSEKLRVSTSSRKQKKLSLAPSLKNKLQKLKDMDYFNIHSSLPVHIRQQDNLFKIKEKLRKDVEFLQSIGVMDYSLIITVAKIPTITREWRERSFSDLEDQHTDTDNLSLPHNPNKSNQLSSHKVHSFHNQIIKQVLVAQHDRNILYSPSRRFAYVFGIIDVLQEYDVEKEFEGTCKKLKAFLRRSKQTDYSVKKPKEYAKRFLEKMDKVFKAWQPKYDYNGEEEDEEEEEEELGQGSYIFPHTNISDDEIQYQEIQYLP